MYNAPGLYTLNFSVAYSSNNYVVVGTAIGAQIRIVSVSSGSFQIETIDSTGTRIESSGISVVVF